MLHRRNAAFPEKDAQALACPSQPILGIPFFVEPWPGACIIRRKSSKTPGCLSHTVLCCSVCTNTCELSSSQSKVQDPGAEETATLASAAARTWSRPDKQALACMGTKPTGTWTALQVISLASHVTCNLQLCYLRNT